jgi:hypothetical protein
MVGDDRPPFPGRRQMIRGIHGLSSPLQGPPRLALCWPAMDTQAKSDIPTPAQKSFNIPIAEDVHAPALPLGASAASQCHAARRAASRCGSGGRALARSVARRLCGAEGRGAPSRWRADRGLRTRDGVIHLPGPRACDPRTGRAASGRFRVHRGSDGGTARAADGVARRRSPAAEPALEGPPPPEKAMLPTVHEIPPDSVSANRSEGSPA